MTTVPLDGAAERAVCTAVVLGYIFPTRCRRSCAKISGGPPSQPPSTLTKPPRIRRGSRN